MSEELGLSSPWINFAREINAFFKEDPEVKVTYNDEENIVKLYVNSDEKADALSALLPMEKEFGNVKLNIEVIPANVPFFLTFENLFIVNPRTWRR